MTAIEIARLQCLIGQTLSAERYVRRALVCAPDERFILRCAARYFVHANQAAEGLKALWKSSVIRTDPWVQAAELALSNLCKQSPRWGTKLRGELLRAKFVEREFSELASGLATLELRNGAKSKHVQHLMAISVGRPTENSLAQAVWAKDAGLTSVEPDKKLFTLKGANEARARLASENREYVEAVEHTWLWLSDEPFSHTAALSGSFICSAHLQDFEQAIKFSDFGLVSHPGSSMLRNNKLVALAMLGRLDEAQKLLREIEPRSETAWLPFLHADRGLIAFRSGDIETGRLSYQTAVHLADEMADPRLSNLAKIYWLEQEAMASTSTNEDLDLLTRELDQNIQTLPTELKRTLADTWTSKKRTIAFHQAQNQERQRILRGNNARLESLTKLPI